MKAFLQISMVTFMSLIVVIIASMFSIIASGIFLCSFCSETGGIKTIKIQVELVTIKIA